MDRVNFHVAKYLSWSRFYTILDLQGVLKFLVHNFCFYQ